jgi:hypothetical protein
VLLMVPSAPCSWLPGAAWRRKHVTRRFAELRRPAFTASHALRRGIPAAETGCFQVQRVAARGRFPRVVATPAKPKSASRATLADVDNVGRRWAAGNTCSGCRP